MTASADSQLIEITRTEDLPVGTTIEVELSSDNLKAISRHRHDASRAIYDFVKYAADWYCWDWPVVRNRIVRQGNVEIVRQRSAIPIYDNEFNDDLVEIQPPGFDSVFWRTSARSWPKLSVNGIRIDKPRDRRKFFLDWPEDEVQLDEPSIAVADPVGNLPLTTQRYGLTDGRVSFLDELTRDVTLSFIAHSLIRWPLLREDVYDFGNRHILSQGQRSYDPSHGGLRWISTDAEFVPVDTWLTLLLGDSPILLCGALDQSWGASAECWQSLVTIRMPGRCRVVDCVLESTDDFDSPAQVIASELDVVSTCPFRYLGHKSKSIELVASLSSELGTNLDDFTSQWSKLRKSRGRPRFEVKVGSPASGLPIKKVLDELIDAWPSNGLPEAIFVAEIDMVPAKEPETLIAKIWQECLGENAIPFDPVERRKLIEHGRKHPDLRRHIEHWEKAKDSGSSFG